MHPLSQKIKKIRTFNGEMMKFFITVPKKTSLREKSDFLSTKEKTFVWHVKLFLIDLVLIMTEITKKNFGEQFNTMYPITKNIYMK
jgi:hypothetical protein